MKRPLVALLALVSASALAAACGDEPRSAGWLGSEPDWDGGPIPTDGPIFDSGPMGPPPSFGPTVMQEKAPPPISGGTLAIAKDGVTAIAADPDRDAVYIVDIATGTKLGTIPLQVDDEPGRVVDDGAGRAHVALRRGGAIVSIDLATRKELSRRAVCPAPRGIAVQGDNLLVACAGGELVTLPAAGGAPTRTVRLQRDLRDVIVRGEKVFVTVFRSAHVLQLDAAGKVVTDTAPRDHFSKPQGRMTPAVAWRAVPTSTGMRIIHQTGQDEPIQTAPGGYGGGFGECGGIVQTVVTDVDETGTTSEPRAIAQAVLAVDVAIDPTKPERMAIAAPGNARNVGVARVLVVDSSTETFLPCRPPSEAPVIAGEPIAVAFTPDGTLVVQSRQPAFVQTYKLGAGKVIELSDVSRDDTGHAIFHANSGNFVACASCHPEGGDDSRVWNFAGLGPRRTQTFRGGILGTEPFHWDGDMKDLRTLMTEVFIGRMSGPVLADDQHQALAKWIDRIPELPRATVSDAAAVARGQALFNDSTVACSSCHAGARFGSNISVDVGTKRTLQVPSLRGVAYRAPFLHSGCAPTLIDRFGTCGGGDAHGKTSQLSAAQLGDLVAYLETL